MVAIRSRGEPLSGQYDWAYRRRDAERWAAYYGVPYREPDDVAYAPRRLALACTAAARLGAVEPFSRRLFQALFVDGASPLDDEVCARLAHEIGLDRVASARSLGDSDTPVPGGGFNRPSRRDDQPALAVLPFVNMSGDPALDYLGPGVAEDIITVLSTFPTIRVISRTSSFTYDEPVKVQEVAQELGVNYVLEGSVRKSAEKIRVTVQLVEAATGAHLWADRFDEEGEDPVALQERVADRIYASLAGLTGAVRTTSTDRAWRKAAADLDEYDYFQRCKQVYFRFTPEDNTAARQICQEGLTAFPRLRSAPHHARMDL